MPRSRGPLDARWVFAPVQALDVFRELLFELGPPAGPSPWAGSAHSPARATRTTAEARIIVLIGVPRGRSRPYHQARQQQRQAERNELRLGQDGLEPLSRIVAISGRGRAGAEAHLSDQASPSLRIWNARTMSTVPAITAQTPTNTSNV
jgi:hypothetical protein